MAEGIDATSFEFYEGIRILVPGALSLGLAEGLVRTFSSDGAGLGLNPFAAIIGALLVGLVFYFIDAPAKAAVFAPLQPTGVIAAWGAKSKHGAGIVNTYFLMLDTIIPGPIRARALYMGSMYRIGMETIYLLAVPSLIAVSVGAWSQSPIRPFSWEQTGWGMVLAAIASVGIWLFAIRRERRARRRPSLPTEVETVALAWSDLVVVVVAVALMTVLVVGHSGPQWLLWLPFGLVLSVWTVRYFRGYKPSTGARLRRPIGASHACLLLAVAELMTLLIVVVGSPQPFGLSALERSGWLVVATLGLTLVCARGHEKRLRGAYATQNTWLALHKPELLTQFFEAPAEGEGSRPRRRCRRRGKD